MIIGVMFSFLFSSRHAWAASKAKSVKRGNTLYEQGKYEASLENYKEALKKDQESAIINFDAGTALFKTGNYKQSIEHLQKALLSDDDSLKEKAYYNLGNAYYKWGIAQEDDDMETALASLEEALDHYEGALKVDEKDRDAKYNYEFVQKELKRLKEKQQQQQQQQKNQGQQDSESQENQQDQNENQQDQQNQQSDSSSSQDQDQQNRQQEQEQEQGGNPEEDETESEQQDQEQSSAQEQQQDQQQSSGQSQPVSAEELTEKEAQMLLENYLQTEEPQGLFKFNKKSRDTAPVLKDW